ncbi:arsenosugar biosynthesis radical SAM (seleno)protein ArsS [Chloroflexus sp.]|uniref:arsenosugar biosynthesis radical SAM (seleno)protein ArsS n=1 Tax=Chloroflexus sp. TaxID=1904827 RepID=UPI00298EE0D5|nr:arsenosugar biosynthesis radical SAM (seleno)protein ArsS [Chloroflexus sp.]MDW8405897.1 arsenosugar biosynthesis radical SAM protein ArsS [Chloroflexus sp.]
MSSLRLMPTLRRQGHPLADPLAQQQILAALPVPPFNVTLAAHGLEPLRAGPRVEVLQINVGRRCNQTCRHCHVDAGPDRTEIMPPEIISACLDLLARWQIPVLDITGGAPEMHPAFATIVRRARALGCHVIDRCNLTIAQLPNYRYLPRFFAEQQVEIIASLPAPDPAGTDGQRGDGVFAQSIATLRELNALGYGQSGSGLLLNLIANPTGPYLPDPQGMLESHWRAVLAEQYGIVFNRLYTLTNVPISRYLACLHESGQLNDYIQLLVQSFNPATVAGLMCRTTLSVGWDGRLYDCDFNQMLDLALPQTILQVTLPDLVQRDIRTAAHCYACTAAAGST